MLLVFQELGAGDCFCLLPYNSESKWKEKMFEYFKILPIRAFKQVGPGRQSSPGEWVLQIRLVIVMTKDWDGHPFSVTAFSPTHVRCIKTLRWLRHFIILNCKFLTTLLCCNFQKRLEHKENQTKYRNMTRKIQGSYVRILIHCWMWAPVILLQIVMVSPGTHVVKNHESQAQSRTN